MLCTRTLDLRDIAVCARAVGVHGHWGLWWVLTYRHWHCSLSRVRASPLFPLPTPLSHLSVALRSYLSSPELTSSLVGDVQNYMSLTHFSHSCKSYWCVLSLCRLSLFFHGFFLSFIYAGSRQTYFLSFSHIRKSCEAITVTVQFSKSILVMVIFDHFEHISRKPASNTVVQNINKHLSSFFFWGERGMAEFFIKEREFWSYSCHLTCVQIKR